jgi:hypothetical protein
MALPELSRLEQIMKYLSIKIYVYIIRYGMAVNRLRRRSYHFLEQSQVVDSLPGKKSKGMLYSGGVLGKVRISGEILLG